MLQQSDTDAHWQDVLARIQTDSQFRQFKKFLYYGEVGGTRVGAVIANKNLQYTSYALNKGDFDRLLPPNRAAGWILPSSLPSPTAPTSPITTLRSTLSFSET